VAVGGSLVFHLLVAVAAMPDPPPSLVEPEVAPVELIVSEPELPARFVPPPIERPPEPEDISPRERQAARPLLAVLTEPLNGQPLPPLPSEPSEPRSPEPSTDEPIPVVIPWVPSPREAARRQALLEDLPPLSDQERVEARVQGIMEGALRPLPNDVSPPPEMHLDSEGNLVHHDGALVAKIHPDGTVDFGTTASVGLDEFDDDGPSDEILDMHTKIPGVPIPLIARRASEADRARGKNDDDVGPGVTFRPNMDLTDLMLKARGEDPLAARKRRFLRLTEELRDGMADENRVKTLSQSKVRAGHNLDRVWSDPSYSFATKRRLLFQLWDECDEPQREQDDRPEAKAGLRARRHILGYVRQKLPPGSAEAFSPDELRRLNSRRESSGPFEPYR
jgi:hypothetical protein